MINSRTIVWARHLTHIGETGNNYRISARITKGSYHLGNQNVHCGIILKYVGKKSVRAWNWCRWLVVFNDAFQLLRLYSVEWKGDVWMMSWKGAGGKRSWPNFKVLFQSLPGGAEENRKDLSRLAGLRAEISIRDFPVRSRSVNHSTTTFGDFGLEGVSSFRSRLRVLYRANYVRRPETRWAIFLFLVHDAEINYD
jgi:hypothetical protein